MTEPIHIIGGGMAGCEAAWQIARTGLACVLHEMRPVRETHAHQTDGLAELVCSNSFRSDDHETNAVGLLHEEMRRAGSIIILDEDGETEVARYNFYEGWPCKWNVPDMDADSSAMAIEKIEIATEKVERA